MMQDEGGRAGETQSFGDGDFRQRSLGKGAQEEGRSGAKALRQEGIWCIRARRPCTPGRDQRKHEEGESELGLVHCQKDFDFTLSETRTVRGVGLAPSQISVAAEFRTDWEKEMREVKRPARGPRPRLGDKTRHR